VTTDGVRDWTPCGNCYPPVSFLTWGTSSSKTDVSAARDASGNSFVAWIDGRGGLYAQMASPSGAPQWNEGGLLLWSNVNAHGETATCPDGAGGAYFAWREQIGNHVFAIIRISALGTIESGFPVLTTDWPTSAMNVSEIELVADGAGGCIAVWRDLAYNGSSGSLKYQHISASGARDWGANGRTLADQPGAKFGVRAVADGAGGVYVAWTDERSGGPEVVVQHIDGAGNQVYDEGGLAIAGGDDAAIDRDPVSGDLLLAWDDTGGLVYGFRIDQWGVPMAGPIAVANGTRAAVAAGTGGRMLVGATGPDYLSTVILAANGDYIASDLRDPVSGGPTRPYVASDGLGGALVAWSAPPHVGIQRLTSTGTLGSLYPGLQSVTDVPNDEGGYVHLSVRAAPADWNTFYDSEDIYGYGVWRRLEIASAPEQAPDLTAEEARDARGLAARIQQSAVRLDAHVASLLGFPGGSWVSVGFMPPNHSSTSYTFLVPTRRDATGAGAARETYVVTSHTLSGIVGYSVPDSGASVDNLAPAAPTGLAGALVSGQVNLSWSAVTAGDLDHYAVYRGTSPGFTPSPSNRIGEPQSTAFSDPGWSPESYYKVSAVDRHDNESALAMLAPTQVTGASDGPAPAFSYLGNIGPNPMTGPGRVEFGLATAGRVSLAVFDPQGRRVRQILDEARGAGVHRLDWDGADAGGRPLSTGVYIVRLEGPGVTATRKLMRVR
jgi:hypothetical protein